MNRRLFVAVVASMMVAASPAARAQEPCVDRTGSVQRIPEVFEGLV